MFTFNHGGHVRYFLNHFMSAHLSLLKNLKTSNNFEEHTHGNVVVLTYRIVNENTVILLTVIILRPQPHGVIVSDAEAMSCPITPGSGAYPLVIVQTQAIHTVRAIWEAITVLQARSWPTRVEQIRRDILICRLRNRPRSLETLFIWKYHVLNKKIELKSELHSQCLNINRKSYDGSIIHVRTGNYLLSLLIPFPSYQHSPHLFQTERRIQKYITGEHLAPVYSNHLYSEKSYKKSYFHQSYTSTKVKAILSCVVFSFKILIANDSNLCKVSDHTEDFGKSKRSG